MVTIRYVIVEQPTEAEPTKYPRLVGRTSNATAAASNCEAGEILVETTLKPNLNNWQGAPFVWYAGIPGSMNMTEDTSNHTRQYCVCLEGGVEVVKKTIPPLIARVYVRSTISASLTIT